MANYNIHFDWNRISTLGKVKILVEQVVGSPSQEAINTAVAQYISEHPGSLSPLSAATKAALLQIAEKVAYIDEHGEDYYDALDAALNAVAVLQITAVYTQTGTVYDTDSLDSLKSDLVVTAYYDDGTTADVTNAAVLSGTLEEGTSTITATYQEKAATFNVTVSHRTETLLHAWDFTQSLVDSVGGLTVALYAGTNIDAPVQTSNGIEFTEPTQRATFSALGSSFNPAGKIFEYKLGTVDFKGNLSYHVRHFMFSNSGQSNAYGLSPLVWRSGTGWACYSYSSSSGTTRAWGSAWPNITGTDLASINYMSGKTVRIAIGSDKHTVSIYIDGTLIGTQTSCYFDTRCPYPMFGGGTSYAQSSGDQCYDLILKEFNIYELPEE